MPTDNRNRHVTVRVTEDELKQVNRQAEERGCSASSVGRQALIAAGVIANPRRVQR